MKTSRIFLAALGALVWCGIPSVHGEERIALVVGNGGYAVSPLDNPSNDARLLTRALEGVGFRVDTRIDANLAEMRTAIDGFVDNLKASGQDAIGLFYFAGHGVVGQSAGTNTTNYLLPIGSAATGQFDLGGAISAYKVVERMRQAGNRLNLLFLDACRNDGSLLPASGLGDVGLIEMDAPPGVLIQFATAPGKLALDGMGANSPYARALADSIRAPGLRLADILRGVREDVERSTNGQQSPEERSGLGRGRFYFRPPTEGDHQYQPFSTQTVDEGWIVSNGRAGMSAGLAAAKRQAFLAARNRALDMAKDGLSESRAYVKDFVVRRQGVSPDSSEYRVELQVQVDELDPADGDGALERHVALMGGPKVLFILSERAEQDGFERPQSGGMAGGLWRVSAGEQVMAQEFRNVGYEAVATDDVIGTGFVDDEELEKARQGIAAFAARIGKAVEADVVVVGTVRYEPRRIGIPGSDLTNAAVVDVSLNAKTVVPSSGKVMASLIRSGFDRDMSGSLLAARERALAKVARAAAVEMKWDLPFRLPGEQLTMRLAVNGVGFSEAGNVERFLGHLPGIDSVRMEGWQQELSKYVVTSRHGGPKGYELAGALQEKFPRFQVMAANLYEVVGGFGR